MWVNITAWTAHQFDVSRYAGPILQKISYFLPVENLGQRIVSDPTPLEMTTATSTSLESIAETIRAVTTTAARTVSENDAHQELSKLGPDSSKSLGSFFSYMTSKWSLSCIIMAIVLNRTHVFAATRRRLPLRWPIRVILRLLPVLFLLIHARRLVRAIQCQTSPEFSDLRWSNSSARSDLMFAYPNVALNRAASTLLMGAADRKSCEAIYMIPPKDSHPGSELQGSLTLLWPLFGVLCTSQFFETVSCAVQGRAVAPETIMTLFEISLAFAEADSALGNQLPWGSLSTTSNGTNGQDIAITRSMVLRRVNTSVEVLLVGLICTFSHITSHLLGMALLQSKYRLLQTSFWALLILGCLTNSFLHFSLDDSASQSLLRYPTVCLIGHIPHMIVLVGIVISASIYAIALAIAIASPPSFDSVDANIPVLEGSGFWARLRAAHSNMQAHLSLNDMRITCATDFYTSLLRAGMALISMASEAVYLQEDRTVNLKTHTWLEEERFKEIERYSSSLREAGFDQSEENPGTMGMVPIKREHLSAPIGYSRERARQEIPRIRIGERKPHSGVGAAERSTRWLLAVEYICKATILFLRVHSKISLSLMRRLGIRWKPRWLVYWSESPLTREQNDDLRSKSVNPVDLNSSRKYSWELPDGVVVKIPRHLRGDAGDVDVEDWLRKYLGRRAEQSTPRETVIEDAVESQLYHWWLKGGFLGTQDGSGDYEPSQASDEDDTSVISEALTIDTDVKGRQASDGGWESWDDEIPADGQRTPTQRSFDKSFAAFSREETPLLDSPMPMSDLARLLDPSSPAEREQARTLAAHLKSDRIMTRSRYKKAVLGQRSRVLYRRGMIGGSVHPQSFADRDEAAVLERIILSRRAEKEKEQLTQYDSNTSDPISGSNSIPSWSTPISFRREKAGVAVSPVAAAGDSRRGEWKSGAAGMGDSGPQCVVCHSEPRTIIVWPCRCLSLCDECRVNLAMNNYSNCVCCRREVVSYSRLFVP